jgi:hypothetical protein
MTKTGRDWLKWVAAGFALVATASAEYELARAIGMNQWIAAAVPGALDAYAVRALRAHREVLTAVLAMVGVNASSHLVTAGVLHVGWPLITAVSAIAPLVLWRVHALSTPSEARARVLWGEHQDEHGNVLGYSSPEAGVTVGGPHPDPTLWTEHTGTVSVPAAPEHAPCPCEHVTGTDDETLCMCSMACSRACGESGTFDEHAEQAVSVASTDGPWTGTHPFPYQWDEHGAGTPVLRLVPDPVPVTATSTDLFAPGVHDYLSDVLGIADKVSTPSTVHDYVGTVHDHVSTGVLIPYDTGFMERARVLMGQSTGVPTVRAIKSELGVGTPRAQRLCAALTIEHEGSTP